VNVSPVRTRRDYEAALREIERLMDVDPPKGTLEDDKLDVLATLVAAYEDEHFPIADPDPIEAIIFRMNQMGLEPKDLEPFMGSRTRVWEILNRRRELTLPMIRALHRGLGIPADVLIGA
jgi:HTH-type transcriptional regulator / antitoxin HigA